MTRTGIGWLLLSAVTLVVLGVRPGAVQAQIEAGFDDPHLALPPESYFNGSQRYYFDDPGREDGEFLSGDLVFHNHFHADASHSMEYWDGWAYSNMTDTTTPGFGNQYSAIAGSGAGGSSNYGVAYQGIAFLGGNAPTVTAVPGNDLMGAYFTNTTYAYWSMKEGDGFAKKFGGPSGNDPDWFLLQVIGTRADGAPAGTVEFYLADYRFADNSQDYLVTDWTWVDLSGLDEPGTLEFQLSSSDSDPLWGMNTPAFFAMDNMVLQGASEKTLTWDGLGDGNWYSDAHWTGGQPGDRPDSATHAVVRIDEVTLAGDGRAYSLLVRDGGRLVVGSENHVDIVTDADIADGTVQIASGGVLDVVGEVTMGAGSEYACQFDGPDHGRIAARGNAHLAGTLTLQALGKLRQVPPEGVQWYGDETRTILRVAPDSGVVGTFDVEPPTVPAEPSFGNHGQGHLGHGVFLVDDGLSGRGVTYGADAVDVDLFQAADGDTNGDRYLNGDDIQAILGANTFATGLPADWTTGDFTGDGICNGDDIQAILATALWDPWHNDPYAASPVDAERARPADTAVNLMFDPAAGGLAINTHDVPINGYVIESASGVFDVGRADNLGWFVEADEFRISGNMGFRLTGIHPLGNVMGDEGDLVDYDEDLTFTYTIEGPPGIFHGTVTVIPEPSTIVMIVSGVLGFLFLWRRRRIA